MNTLSVLRALSAAKMLVLHMERQDLEVRSSIWLVIWAQDVSTRGFT
jgi:hypothetical protein